MNKKTKLILGGLGLVALYLAYKNGVFGGKSSSGPTSSDSPAESPREQNVYTDNASGANPDTTNADKNTFFVTSNADSQNATLTTLPNNFAMARPITHSFN